MNDRYVDTDVVGGAGDGTSWANAYLTLNDCIVAEAATLTDILTIHCRGTTGDTEAVVVNGYTVASDKYIKIVVDQADRHHGVYNTDHYHLGDFHTGTIIDVYEHWTRIEGLQFSHDNSTQTVQGNLVYVQGGTYSVQVECCVAKGRTT